MKILLVSILSFPSAGGIWTYVSELAKGLRGLGHTVDILSFHPIARRYYLHANNRVVEDKSIPWILTKAMKGFRPNFWRLGQKIQVFELRRYRLELTAALINLKQYDLIHAQEVFSAIALSRVKPKESPLVTTIHGAIREEFTIKGILNPHTPRRYTYVTLLEKQGIKSSSMVIVPTNYMKNRFITDFQAPEQQFTVIPLGFDINHFRNQMDQQTNIQRNENQKVIICTARLEKEKGHIYLLQALQRLKKVRTDWKCLLAGSGSLQKTLREKCIQMGIDRHVVFLGYRTDIPAILKQSDIFVLASIQENHPFAIMEAQTAGKVVIGASTGGIPELIQHQKTGLLFSKMDSNSLFRQLVEAFENENLQESLSSHAREWADSHWSIHTMLDRIDELYHRLALSAKGRKSIV